jgi:hypothetical protein
MIKIFFFSPAGYAPLKDESLRGLLQQSHGCQLDGAPWVYGVCIPIHTADPSEVADRLQSLGVHVLPGIHDTDGKPDLAVVTALAKHGIVSTDGTKQIADKMHVLSGMPVLRPHYF